MTIEQEVSQNVFRMMELHCKFADGLYEEMNRMYSDDFQGWLYMPRVGELERYDAVRIREGNQQAAEYYNGRNIQFVYSGLTVMPQSCNEAAASFEITFHDKDNGAIVRALALEVWRKENDGEWRLIRWYEEKGRSTPN